MLGELNGRGAVRVAQHRREAVGQVGDQRAGVVVLGRGNERRDAQQQQHQRLDRQRGPHHSAQEVEAFSQHPCVHLIDSTEKRAKPNVRSGQSKSTEHASDK